MKEMKKLYLRPTTGRPFSVKPNASNVAPPHHKERLPSANKNLPYLEKERLYENCIHLKSSLNNLSKQLRRERSENIKKEIEIKKKEKMFNELFTETQGSFMSQTNLFKIKEANLISNLKRQFKTIKKELIEKEDELDKLKKTIKGTKIKEAQMETQVYLEELRKLKEAYEVSLAKSLAYDKLRKDFILILERCNRQEALIKQLQDENKHLKLLKEPRHLESVGSSKLKQMKQMEDEEIQEFTYILAKTFEARNISPSLITEMEKKNNHASSSSEEIANKLIALLKVKNLNDKAKILSYTSSVKDVATRLESIIKSLSLIKENEEQIKSKLSTLPDKDMLLKSFENYDPNKTGWINLQNFNKVLQGFNLNLDKEAFEYLIHIMKLEQGPSLYDLNYSKLIELSDQLQPHKTSNRQEHTKRKLSPTSEVNNKIEEEESSFERLKRDIENDDVKLNTSKNGKGNTHEQDNNEVINENEDEVVITVEQFHQRVDRILSSIAGHLHSYKITIKDMFKELITPHEINEDTTYDSISLKDFIGRLQELNIPLDTIDIYCIFSKLKYNDDYETIDVAKIYDEMANYGIFEESMLKKEMENIEDS